MKQRSSVHFAVSVVKFENGIRMNKQKQNNNNKTNKQKQKKRRKKSKSLKKIIQNYTIATDYGNSLKELFFMGIRLYSSGQSVVSQW